jgi:putative hemolysin
MTTTLTEPASSGHEVVAPRPSAPAIPENMTIPAVPTSASANRTPAPEMIAVPRYSLEVSSTAEHREAAQRLRHQVFAAEPGFVLPRSLDGRDVDRFDEFCDHMLVRDDASGRYVGCYRLLPPTAAAEHGYYTATEFDLGELDPLAMGVVEMGRASVLAEHRNGSVLAMMWAGILHYLELTGFQWVMGCVSVPMQSAPDQSPGSNVRGVRDFLLPRHAAEPCQTVRPYRPVQVDGHPLDEIEPPARPMVPPLLRGYLRMNAKICGEPAHDPEFGVADFVALLSIAGANRRYLDRLRSAAEMMGN